METPELIVWMIGGCVLFILFLFFARPFKGLLKLLIRAVAGGAGFLLCNGLLAWAGIASAVGVNALTVFVVAILGAPGFVMLYLMQWVLK